MTVQTTVITAGPYAGNDIVDAFAYAFRITSNTQLKVFETDDAGVETELMLTTDYTVSGVGIDGGGEVTRVAGALPTNYTWYIRSNYLPTQLSDLDSQGAFFPEIHEEALDKLTFLVQQIDDLLGRSVSLSESYDGSLPITLSDPEAGKYLQWNSAGDGFINASGTSAPSSLQSTLTEGNNSGVNDIIMDAGQKITTDTIDETTAAAGVTIDGVLLKDGLVDGVDVTTFLDLAHVQAAAISF